MNVVITKSNCTFVKVGEITEILDSASGDKLIWSNSLLKYEKLSWAVTFWSIEYEELNKGDQHGNTH